MQEATNVQGCQSCEMPMTKPEDFGKNADGSRNEDYCCHCWENGAFSGDPDWTLEKAIEFNIPYVIEGGFAKTEDEARAMLRESMPKLKRWAKQ
ncbi:MAG: zinc ribbon domain-containing protein [Treponema sp.]|nr:zinc ribbon domain-containing protein [Treponema sp.]